MKFLSKPKLTLFDYALAFLVSHIIFANILVYILPMVSVLEILYGLFYVVVYFLIWNVYCKYRKEKAENVDI